MYSNSGTQLITYPDSLGGNLDQLYHLLTGPLKGIFPGGIHILPPFPSSGDRGFSPITYFEIDPQFGSWEDIRRIGAQSPIMLDLMVNHISRRSPYFQDFIQKGRRSEYADLFIPLDKVWPGGEPAAADIARIFLRRPEHPFLNVTISETGETERIWATFGGKDWAEQIDIDVNSEIARRLFRQILAHFRSNGVRWLRLDAIAYITKQAGTNCFFVEPQIFEFLEWIHQEAGQAGIQILPEVHAHWSIQEKLAKHGFWVYNFALPMLILHAILTGKKQYLLEHLEVCPQRQVTTLDTHDGIPVQPDINDLLPVDEAQAVVSTCLERGANISRVFSVEHRLRPDYDAHQINCTYFSALDTDPDAYLLARAIQFFTPGIPQVYYVGLLAGVNAPEEVLSTGVGRAINRRNYSYVEVEAALQKPVVQRLLALIRFRNEFPAFAGDFRVQEDEDGQLRLSWEREKVRCILSADLTNRRAVIEYQSGYREPQRWQV